MKPPTLCLLLSLLFLTTLQAQRGSEERGSWGSGGRGDRVSFDNRSASPVTIFKRTGLAKFAAFRNLAPGEAFAMPAVDGQIWTVATPVWYRPIDAIEVGETRRWGGNRVLITDEKLSSIGKSQVRLNISNRTGRTVALALDIGGMELDWSRVRVGRTELHYGFRGQEWIARDLASGDLLDRFTVGSQAETIVIDGKRDRRGHGHGRGAGLGGIAWGGERETTPAVKMSVTNRSSRPVAVLKRTALGSRTIGTIGAGRTGRIDTKSGDVWRIEDSETFEVLKTVTVPSGRRDYSVQVDAGRRGGHDRHDHRPTTKPAPREVTLRIYNDTSNRIDIYRQQGGASKHAKRINQGRYWDLDFEAGEKVSVRDPDSGRELEAFRAPQGDRVVRISGHETGDDTPTRRNSAPREEDAHGGGGEVIGRGAILRRIFGGE